MKTATAVATPPPVNRLAAEKSPYLLQHQHNPVDWYPWGEAAFARARQENKPIFLSIGYSTCHWCHVMERESFENEAVARVLNEHFISVKVDREERPDLDRIYMTFVQATTGQGGWPLTVFLTPDRKPFVGGTYFPPESRYGRPGLLEVLEKIQRVWASRGNELTRSAAELHAQLEAAAAAGHATGEALTPEILQNAATVFKQAYDARNGGFGSAPKFPQPSVPRLLLRGATRFQDEAARQMVLHTCERMAAGGIHDQLGGGFARYSVDAEWLVPHFEKMLYDNAQLAELYLDAFLVSGDARHAATARDILDYVLRDMTHPEGGFYSAEDADSEGHEGKFYCWTLEELTRLLEPAELAVATRYFGITAGGNFVDHSHPNPLPGQNVLSVADPNLTEAERELLASARHKMAAARAGRVRPHLDDKILSSWNGLMLGAMARGGVVLEEPRYRAAAERNLHFIQTRLWEPQTKTLYHRWRDGEHDRVQLLEAYAFLLDGVLELYETTLEPATLEFALGLADTLLAQFYDQEPGGFWHTVAGEADVILRIKEDYDGALPSGNSVAVLALLKLGRITDRKEFLAAAEETLRLFATRMREMPQAMPRLLEALDFSLDEPKRFVVAGGPANPDTRGLLRTIHLVYQPNKVVLGNTGPVEAFAQTLPATQRPVAYVCTGTACQPPTSDPAQLRELAR